MAQRKADRPEKKRKGRAPKDAPKPASRSADDDELLADLRAAVDLVEHSATGIKRPPGPKRDPGRVEPADRPPLDDACQKLIELVRRRCPGLLPAEPLRPGTASSPLPVHPKEAAALMSIAARQAVLSASGLPVPTDADQLPKVVLWQAGPAALLVEVGQIDVHVADGLVSVAIPVRCDQLPRGRDVVVVDLVLGTPDRPTGMLAAASEPRGPRIVVRQWGEALTALAWQALLDTAGGVAAATGADQDGAVLIPTGLTSGRDGIAILAQARHEFDRVRPGQVVLAPVSES